MIRLNSLEQYSEILASFANVNEKRHSNCFLMPSEITALCNEGKLFIKEYPRWIFILCERNGYSNLYYITTEGSDISYAKEFMEGLADREIYMDTVSRNGRGDTETPERLVSADVAEKYKTYQRMQLPVKTVDFDNVIPNIKEGYRISTDYCDYNALTELWKDTLDEKSTPLPSEEELLNLFREGNLFTAFDSEDNLAAAIVLSGTSTSGIIQHVSVSKRHRRMGLATSLMNKVLLSAKEKGITMLRLWVDCRNSAAIALYDGFNFKKDGMICDQLYMKGR